MNLPRAVAQEAKTRWLQGLGRDRARMRPSRPVVSLSFDDVPVSAVRRGAAILERYDVRATYYVSLGLGSGYAGPDEVRELTARGHEIGCHTYSHYRLTEGTVAGLCEDARRNREALAEVLGGEPPRSFSFPFGRMSLAAKRALSPHYETLRSSRPGINVGRVDLNCLRSMSLGIPAFSPARLDGWLSRTLRAGGWLVLYTHAIVSRPGRYDLTPAALENLVQRCLDRGLRIRPVREVAHSLGGRAGSAGGVGRMGARFTEATRE